MGTKLMGTELIPRDAPIPRAEPVVHDVNKWYRWSDYSSDPLVAELGGRNVSKGHRCSHRRYDEK